MCFKVSRLTKVTHTVADLNLMHHLPVFSLIFRMITIPTFNVDLMDVHSKHNLMTFHISTCINALTFYVLGKYTAVKFISYIPRIHK